jgi:hypothetical protein
MTDKGALGSEMRGLLNHLWVETVRKYPCTWHKIVRSKSRLFRFLLNNQNALGDTTMEGFRVLLYQAAIGDSGAMKDAILAGPAQCAVTVTRSIAHSWLFWEIYGMGTYTWGKPFEDAKYRPCVVLRTRDWDSDFECELGVRVFVHIAVNIDVQCLFYVDRSMLNVNIVDTALIGLTQAWHIASFQIRAFPFAALSSCCYLT